MQSYWRGRADKAAREQAKSASRASNDWPAALSPANFEISEILACSSHVSRKKEVADSPSLETSVYTSPSAGYTVTPMHAVSIPSYL